MRIARLRDEADWQALVPAIETIFFATSRAPPAEPLARAAFRERWLGRYLDHYLDSFFVGVAPDGTALGYLAGCLDDAARTPLFGDLGFYRDFAALGAAYPGHLHVNVAAHVRGRGIGAALIEAFAAQAAAAGLAGIHIVTNAAARNVGFYHRNGFRQLATCRWNEATNVFMGRALSA
jgi:GNAT superfamily N-acetyltransferase